MTVKMGRLVSHGLRVRVGVRSQICRSFLIDIHEARKKKCLLYSSHSAGALPARVYSFHRHGDKWFPRPFPRCLNESDPPMECMERLLKFRVIACAEAEDRL
jgi:hypothetical protein